MKRIVIFVLSSILIYIAAGSVRANDPAALTSLPTPSSGGQPLTLKDCFRLANAQSETLKIQKENIIQSEQKGSQSLGEILPNLHWYYNDTIQDTSGVTPASSGNAFLTDREHNESQFTLTQPIFSGGREFSAMKGFKYQASQQSLTLRRETLLLFQETATAFYNVIAAQARIANTRASLKLAEERVGDLQHRAQLGKTRESEVLSAQAQVANLKATEILNLRDFSTYVDQLSYLTGQEMSNRTFLDELPVDEPVPSIDQLLQHVDNRSDVQAQQDDLMAKRYNVRYQAGYYWPHLGLTGNYYTKRLGFQQNVDWDVIFALDVPIYQGGSVRASVKEAASQWRQSSLMLDMLRRQAQTEIRQARTSLVAAIDGVKSLAQAYNAAKQSYDLQVKEYRLGLVSNLDVIAALDTLQTDKTALDNSTYLAKLNYLDLKVAIEDLP